MPVPTLSRRSFGAALAGALGASVLGACGDTGSSRAAVPTTATAGRGLFDAGVVHDIDVAFARADYDAMVDAYLKDETKNWIEASVTVDGTTFEKVGLRLKGNSSLRGLTRSGATTTNQGAGPGGGPGGSVSAENPQDLPWLVRLDKFVEAQALGGWTEFVVRSNNSGSALNEAVALELLGLAGLATQRSVSTRLSVDGGTEVLRLIIENPGDKWDAGNFGTPGILYKAEAGGDYSYRGDEAAGYEDVFDQETDTGNPNLAPLAAFLKFVNQSGAATFGAELDRHLDVTAFASYLAVQQMIANSDDIDGPGNNSYLRYTTGTGRFTVVAWDHNLAFGSMGGGNRGGAPAGAAPGGNNGGAAPGGNNGGAAPGAGNGGGQAKRRMGGRGNILVERFNADTTFKASYEKALTDLRAKLYTSGRAAEILQARAAVLTAQASDLVSTDTVTRESAAIRAYFA